MGKRVMKQRTEYLRLCLVLIVGYHPRPTRDNPQCVREKEICIIKEALYFSSVRTGRRILVSKTIPQSNTSFPDALQRKHQISNQGCQTDPVLETCASYVLSSSSQIVSTNCKSDQELSAQKKRYKSTPELEL